MTTREFYEAREKYQKEQNDEVLRVMEIMDDHGYELCDHVDFNYSNQFVKVETIDGCKIISWIWAVPKKEQFKAVLKWFAGKTKFNGVTAIMYGHDDPVLGKRARRIPTFHRVDEIEKEYNEYFGW